MCVCVCVCVCVSGLSQIFVSFPSSYFSWDTSFSVLQEKLPQVSQYLKLIKMAMSLVNSLLFDLFYSRALHRANLG